MSYTFGKDRIYNEVFEEMGYDNIVKWDVFEIKQTQELMLEFLNSKSEYQQGVRIAVDYGDGYVEVNGIKAKGMQLWENTCPQNLKIKCFSPEGRLSVYNIFDLGSEQGGIRSQVDSSGMIVKVEGETRTYFCNDAGFETDFDKLVFAIRLL